MRIQLFFILIFLISSFQVTSQETVLTIKNEDLSKRIKKDSYTISNEENKDLVVIVIERKKIYAYLYDGDFNLKSTIETENVKSKYNKVLGYSINDEKYSILYTNEDRNKFSILHLNFKELIGNSEEIDLDLGDDLLLDAVNFNNNLFLLTAIDQSTLSLRKFNNISNFEIVKTSTLDEVSNKTGLISSKVKVGLFILSGYEKANITKIDHRVSNSIEHTSKENKLYQNEQFVYLTFDGNDEGTLMYTINLYNYNVSLVKIPYPKDKVEDFKKTYNSFLFEDKLFQITSSKEKMTFVIKSLKGETIKEYVIRKNLPIAFKNSPIIQEGQTAIPFVTKREMEQTNRYLRKVSSSDIGIDVVKNKGNYYITLGGYKYISNGAPIMPVTTANGAFTGYNTTYFAYNGYTTTRSTYFNSILDSNFNHVQGEFKENAFDKIKAYQSKLKYISGEDVFIRNNHFYLGYFNQKESEYHIVRF